jgi:hypothetical protein
LTQQIVDAYLQISGRGASTRSNIAAAATVSIADPIVARLINPEALLNLLNKGSLDESHQSRLGPIPSASFWNPWRLWWNSEYSGANFYLSLPTEAPRAQQFRLRFRLLRWQWKLAGIDLPEEVRLGLARQLLKAHP